MPNPPPTVQPRQAVAPRPASAPQVMPNPGKGAPIVANPAPPAAPAPMTQRHEVPESLAPLPKPEAFSPPALPAITGLAPRPYRNLLYFSDLEAVLVAITQVKARAADQGGRFAWVRARYEPEISAPSFAELKKAVFGRESFKAETLLNEAIAKLPAEIAAQAKANRAETLQLEGLWIEFPPKTGAETATTRLSMAVSIALSSPEPTVGPFAAKRIYLTFGDFQP